MAELHELIAPEALAAVERPTAEARGLPNAAYTSAELMRYERDHVLARAWTCVGVASDLPACGDVAPVSLLGLPLFTARDAQGTVRVFHNVCSHRGQQLVARPCRVRGLLRCPYHSWTYGLDGCLRGTPHIGGAGAHQVAGFERTRHGLVSVRSAVWHDLIFVNLSGDAPPFEAHIAPLAERWHDFWGEDGPPRLHRVAGEDALTFEVACNWKLAVENYCESYHLPWVHPGLNTYSRLEDHYHILGGELFSGQGSRAYNLACTAGITLPRLPGWPRDREGYAEYVALYPNTLLGIHVDHFFSLTLEPIAPDRTVERLRVYYFAPQAVEAAYATARRTLLESWRVVFQEDVSMVEGMQRGRASPAFEGGVFSPVMDTPTHHFHKWVAARLREGDGACRPRSSSIVAAEGAAG
jgi:choline monooxygenase